MKREISSRDRYYFFELTKGKVLTREVKGIFFHPNFGQFFSIFLIFFNVF